MNTNAEILSQVKSECIQCDEEKETHELCMDCVKKIIEENKKPIDAIPSRIKYYLLEWKDKNMERFVEMCGEVSLSSLTKSELKFVFDNATMSDLQLFS